MDLSVLTLCLLPLLSGTLAQHSVIQEPSVTATPGQTVKLPCTLGGGITMSSGCVRFVQQKLGQAPRGLLYYCSDSNKGKADGVPDRFVGSGSGSVGYLTITNVRAEDDADYYCFTWTGSQHTLAQVMGK
ncbi:hypothetical protein NDU88_006795 [Pleurodeles waltl]|uniref:Ig-like domain-containing protein n=1 Tax=Pleurodeles waltl TaxID=8319 RepID=A0AAV7LRU1_PLEWA|nr:hypothetical protein NDU88_006795 [Pleurodeles waltl]